MYAHGADGIVDVKLKVEQLDHENNQEAGNDTNNGSAYCVKGVAARGDGHKTRERGVEAHGNIGFAVPFIHVKSMVVTVATEGAIVVVRNMEASSEGWWRRLR